MPLFRKTSVNVFRALSKTLISSSPVIRAAFQVRLDASLLVKGSASDGVCASAELEVKPKKLKSKQKRVSKYIMSPQKVLHGCRDLERIAKDSDNNNPFGADTA